MTVVPSDLPIHAVKASLLAALPRGPVVVSSPTGSGKSTEVPRWQAGRVVVIEPRRIACRSLAVRVAHLEGAGLGEEVGYVVRDEHVASESTRIVFATPGVALRSRALLDSADTIILDEFHERSLEVDLLLALLLRRRKSALIVMSATLDGERVAKHVGGVHVCAEGRTFPVDVRYVGHDLPDPENLAARVRAAVDATRNEPGDVLVFLPGKAEIDACERVLTGMRVLPLHGGLSLDEQRRVFAPHDGRQVILATNVAETSLTIPAIGVVIDSGLVRQTRYHDGRGFLTLVPIAEDSAGQRAGRAGRTAPGVCLRLWGAAARLATSTLPEIHRESIVPLVMAASAWGERVEDLSLLDAPKPYAIESARTDLAAWGALAGEASLSESGRELFALPIDPPQARLLIEARERGCLAAAIDLVSVLAVGRPLLLPGARTEECDATALVNAMRRPEETPVSAFVLAEANRIRGRLRRLLGSPSEPFDRDALLHAAIAADPRVVHVARKHGRFSNGGTELELARESAVQNVRNVEAIVVLDTRAFGSGRDTRVLVTCASAIPLSWIARAGLGRDRVESVHLERGRVLAKLERVYAKRVVSTREEVPTGEAAREAIATLFLRGSIFKDALAKTREHLALAALAVQTGHRKEPVLPLTEWVAARLETLGVESGDDLAMLSASDFLAPDLPFEVRSELEREYPRSINVGDARYEAEYDLQQGQVMLRMVSGSRRDPPPPGYLPKFAGLRVCLDGPRGITVLRARR